MAKKGKVTVIEMDTGWNHTHGKIVYARDGELYFAFVQQEDGELIKYVSASGDSFEGGQNPQEVEAWLEAGNFDSVWKNAEPVDEAETVEA